MAEFDLNRFLEAQERDYATALAEMKNGAKLSHWIWYIFPQQKGLGHSYNSRVLWALWRGRGHGLLESSGAESPLIGNNRCGFVTCWQTRYFPNYG